MKILALTLLCVILFLGAYCQAEADATIKDVRGALQNKQFETAAQLTDSLLGTADQDRDLLLYLKGLSFFYNKDFAGAIQSCRKVISEHESSPWYRKAVFLKAQCHIKLKQFEEAESIYDQEVRRLLSASRKEEIAGIYFRFAEAVSRKPGKNEPDAPPPNYEKAYKLYKMAMELEIGTELRDETMFRLGRMMHLAGRYGHAVNHYREYLDEFDPEWLGPVDSPRRQKKAEGQIKQGKHTHEARYHLAECQVAMDQERWARINLEDLVKLLAADGKSPQPPLQKGELRGDLQGGDSELIQGGDSELIQGGDSELIQGGSSADGNLLRNARYLMIKTYRFPKPRNDEELALGIKAAKAFLTEFSADARSISLAYEIGQAYQEMGRSEEAISAYRNFLEVEYYEPDVKPDGESPQPPLQGVDSELMQGGSSEGEAGESHAERFQRLRMAATYKIGEILFSQKKYGDAMQTWNQYVAQFPNGPQWADAQQGMVNAEFQMGRDLLAEEKYDEAIQAWDKFLEKHPLDSRSRQIMFVYGQIHYHNAEEKTGKRENGKGREDKGKEEYRKAIAEWEKLVNKYPNTEESSLALFRIGQIYEEKLGDPEKALESYRKLKWGSWQRQAQGRVHAMIIKGLMVSTERTFRTNEPARIKVFLRNIEKLTVNVYNVDMEAYWRKMHKVSGIEDLDIALIAPDETWEYKVPDYEKYKVFEQEIEIPMDGPGVRAVYVGEEDLEATTLVIRSDVDAIIKASRQEVLVFAENMVSGKPVPGAKVLVSEGAKVIAEGETAEDGVFHKKIEGLKNAEQVTYFVVKDGSVASESLWGISELGLSAGLSARGYIYTDRPVYRPGQEVFIRAIIRDVSEGSYSVSPGAIYKVSIVDSQGRLLHSEKLSLSAYGTLHTRVPLDEDAPVGEYRITAELVKEEKEADKGKVYTGGFLVEKFQLEKMKLAIDFPRRVYFRGEKVEATFTASYYYGQPVVKRLIRYTLPDGRSYTEETDAEGKLKVDFDTSSMQPDTSLNFTGTIEGENVQVMDTVFLARLGFSISLKPSDETVISGEPFDVAVETLGADGKPVGKELTLTVYRRTERETHPILSQVPWMENESRPAGEVKVEDHKVITEEKTGKGTISVTLEDGGSYIIRAAGTDRFDQPVSGDCGIFISDNKDKVKLRIFAKRSKLKVGETEKVRIHSRLKPSLALLTFEGEGIIHHEVITLDEGWNELEFTVGHEHFPNFHIAVAVIDGQELRSAGKDFTVERQLMVSMKLDEFYLPGEEAEVQVTATDQLGNPVEAEISLALVNEALFAVYEDSVPPITDFFNEGIHRDAAMRIASSCTFKYRPTTQRVARELLEEEKRLETEAEYDRDRGEALETVESFSLDYGVYLPEDTVAHAGLKQAETRQLMIVNGPEVSMGKVMVEELALQQEMPVRGARRRIRVATDLVSAGYEGLGEAGGFGAGIAVRQDISTAGAWLPEIVTDADGKATAKISMPEAASQWRLTARGCTVETLVGQNTANTITRKDFFVDIKIPSIVTEGDKVRVLSRVHNLTDFTGVAVLKLTLSVDGTTEADTAEINVKDGTTEFVFDGVEIPAGREARVEVTVQAGQGRSDGVSRTIPIRPWGMEYMDSRGGVSTGDETIFLQLPGDVKVSNRRLSISVGPDVNRLIFELAMGRGMMRDLAFTIRIPPVPGDAGSDLLASAYALGYLKRTGGKPDDGRTLLAYVRRQVSHLVISQRDDGGWSWCSGSADSDPYISSRALWALAEARRQGISVNNETMEKATSYLKGVFARSEQTDDDTKSVILHSLSEVGEADFAYANRLYRNRNQLSPSALAYTALIFANLERKEIGGEIVDGLTEKAWENAKRGSEAETAALALLALESIRPNSPLVKQAVEYLLSRRTHYGYSPYRTKGPAVAALAIYYGETQFEKSDYRLKVSVNGKEIEAIKENKEQEGSAGASPSRQIHVPTDLVKDGKNKVEFQLEGNGRYAYTATLTGFSPEIKDPESWERPYILSRRYYHAPLEYKGRQIASSTTELTQLEDGARTYVSVDIKEEWSSRYLIVQEYLPAGTVLVQDSVSGNYQHYEAGDSMITFYYPPGRHVRDYRYQLVSYAPGAYRVMPSVIRDAMLPGEMRLGVEASLEVLAPGEKSKDEYKMNDGELYGLGEAYFSDGNYADALSMLTRLYDRNRGYNQREVARMLLWIHTEDSFYDARKVIEYFEILRERFPELYIPFDKILVVGSAYKEIEEFERAYLVYKATVDASFINDSNVSAVLEDEGQFLSSIDFQEDIWREYPDSPQVISSYFALSQAIYSKVPEADQLGKSQLSLLREGEAPAEPVKITKLDLLKETALMLGQFLTLYPEDPLADDASFSLANVLLDLEDFQTVVGLCQAAQKRYPKSEYITSFQYVEALGYFSQHKYDEAIGAANVVADGKSKDRDLARYILGQIFHAQGSPETAIDWYKKVEDIYPDARESISYFQEKRVSLDEVKVVRPGDDAKLEIKYRNIREASLQVYKVDLMKLYLREKDLSKIQAVQLAGIEPEFSKDINLGDGKDYVDKEHEVDLGLKDEGAYLVICRGDDLFSSGLVLVTPLDMKVQEDAVSGRVRVNVRDLVKNVYKEGVHVKAVGSAEQVFKSGETDLRGLFIADDVRGKATIIARAGNNQYAFYRGEQWLGPREEAQQQVMAGAAVERLGGRQKKADYRANIDVMNAAMQASNVMEFDQMRRGVQKGVQVQLAH